MSNFIDPKIKHITDSGLVFDIDREYSKEDSLKANKILYKRYIKKQYLFLFYLCLLLPSIMYLSMDFISNDSYLVWMLFIFGFVFVCASFGFLIGYFIRKSIISSKIDSLIRNNAPHKISFYNDGFVYEGGGLAISRLYSELHKVEDIDGFLFFYYTSKQSLCINKEILDVYQESFFDLLLEKLDDVTISGVKNIRRYKTNEPLGIILMFILFMVSMYVFDNTYYLTPVSITYSFFMVRLYLIIYNRFVNHINAYGIVIVTVLSFLSVFLGYYFFYVNYYAGYFTDSYIYLYVFLFKIIRSSAILDYFKDSAIVFSVGYFSNVLFMALNYFKDDKKPKDKVKLKNKFHVSNKIGNTIIYLISIIFIAVSVMFYNSYTILDIDPDEVFRGYTSSTPLSIRYQDKIDELKELNDEAYEAACEIFDNQEYILNHNVNEYYVSRSNDTITLYSNLDIGEYCVYYEVYDYGLKTECEWSDWYEMGGFYNYIDLNIKTCGEGYSVIVITNDFDDQIIEIFVDGVKRERTSQSYNSISLSK